MDKQITLYVVRHGQTYFNIYNKLQGWSNSPLTEAGIADAQQAGDRLKTVPFAAAYCSDTTRAEQTARTILAANQSTPAPKLTTSPFFREEFYGYYEGTDMAQAWYLAGAPHGVPTFKDIESTYSIGKAKDFLKEADPFRQAENNQEYWARVDQGFDLIRQNPYLKDGDQVLMISHGNTLLSLMERYGQGKYDLSVRPANGSLTKLLLTPDDIQVLSYNQKD
ncbi:histidine phosphatase family protein [Levilactobacillus namurensis]|uniref:histidine phosphatase family protein n=1 Tax=Levilactobacillus namurensis TaxID=380393 RepID=UPI00223080AF|nr:histidine phosphatase family protein [Levilactobacillus namurensis]MCW3778209.1 histidine phosphatase family protein [Levilactobacillus namurensis]MDT7019177.1 histidine phosphatase family protein [Levilactobacillus namurensis]WNN66218.1 histidine phosphatase family protein [Levilactobacillus namurensis]